MRNYDNNLLAPYSVTNGYAPNEQEGPRSVGLVLDFSTDREIYLNMYNTQAASEIGVIQTLIIDNTKNTFPIEIVVGVTGQRISIPAQTEICRPLMSSMPFQATFSCSAVTAALVTAQLLNVPLPPYSYGVQAVSATVSTITGAYTNRSGTIAAGGVSQVLMAANAGRKGFVIQNPSNEIESLWINFTAAANVGQPSIELTPGSSFPYYGAVSTEAINVLAATLGHAYIAKELL